MEGGRLVMRGRMYTQKDLFSLVGLVDAKTELIVKVCQHESEKYETLLKERENLEKRIQSANTALRYLSEKPSFVIDDNDLLSKINDCWAKISSAKDASDYIKCAENFRSIFAMKDSIAKVKNDLTESEKKIELIKGHKDYKSWVTNADKMNFWELRGAMPERIVDYSPKALKILLSYSTKVLWAPYKRYMFYYLYKVYKEEIRLNQIRQETITNYLTIIDFGRSNLSLWIKAIKEDLALKEKELENVNHTIDIFDVDSRARILEYSDSLIESIESVYPSESFNGWMSGIENSNVSFTDVNSKDDIVVEPKEDFVLFYEYGKGKFDFTFNEYTISFAQNIISRYNKCLFAKDNLIHFKHPNLLHLDSLRYKMAINANGMDEFSRSALNGIVQHMVGSVVANLPVGKVKLIFGDPANTGVFSTFRDVGKNESEGSRLSTYIVDVDSIRKEFERLSNEIAYTINNILKGTKTTLYQHNKERSFNSSPYEFLFLMDYPQNMTAQSLQALKNIVENGPKCGIFTIIFNAGGSAMQMLRPEEATMAEEIATGSYSLFKNFYLINRESMWIVPQEEITSAAVDKFTKFYNEAIKESQQLTVYIDELVGEVCKNGEYKIPIGKNLGGEIEYMSFFGSCQDYLMSGATRIGKTNALHVIIYNTIKYVPNAELYLVDFKQGVEFAPYARLNTPVVKALAVESVPEFGHAVLKHIEDKIKAISELFIANSVKNWKEYYEKTGKVIPVTIVVLDEFQHLFDTGVGADCSRIIEVIAKEGGAFNVHVILATQSMSSVAGLTETAKINIFGRMAFYHSELEYSSMLWGDTHLALTLNGEVKGQMVFATGDKNSQRLLQWALAKPAEEVVDELSYPISEGRYQTKLLLSTIRDNPFSIFNAIINGTYRVVDPSVCELTIGNEVNVFTGELRKQIESEKPVKIDRCYEESYLKLKKASNENLLIVGNNESLAESIFQLSIYCVLAKQVASGKKSSIVVLAPDMATHITDICDAFKEYISYYGQEDDLSTIDLEKTEYMFVFGLQNFRSMSYQPDSQLIAARNEATKQRMTNGIMPMSGGFHHYTDGQILQSAVESNEINVIAWHNSVANLTSMFGGMAKIQDFLYKFAHKIVFRLTDKNEAVTLINSESCLGLSGSAAIYVKMNRERIIRPYKAMDSDYCKELNSKLMKIAEGENA